MKGLRFRRSIKIAPGVRWNFGKASSSLSFGPRGAKLTMGTRGTRVTAGLPGTGLWATHVLPSSSTSRASGDFRPSSSNQAPWDRTLPGRMGIDNTRDKRKLKFQLAGLALAVVGFGACTGQYFAIGIVVFMTGLAVLLAASLVPSTAQAAMRERDRRIAELLATEVDQSSAESVDALLAKREAFALTPAETPQVERVVAAAQARQEATDALRELERQMEAAGGALPVVSGHERIVGRDACHLTVAAYYDKRGPNDENGTLYLTTRKALFAGLSRTEAPWAKVASVTREDRTILIQRRDRQLSQRFVLSSLRDAALVEAVARVCLEKSAID